MPQENIEFDILSSETDRRERPSRLISRDFISHRFILWVTTLNVSLLMVSITLFVQCFPIRNDLNVELKKVSAFSPVLESSHIPLVDQQVSGDLFLRRDGSDLLGRAAPGSETDAQWDEFERQRWFAISSEDVRRLGKDPRKTVKFPPEYGLGDDAYMAGLDIFHQIHCLDNLRREAFKDYYWDGEKYHMEMYAQDDPPERQHSELWWLHLRHCTDILLQTLVCHADTDMLTLTWMEKQKVPFPDFSINRKCKSFDAVKKWRDKHAEPSEKIHTLKKPGDLVGLHEQYWELFGNATYKGDNTHHPWSSGGQ